MKNYTLKIMLKVQATSDIDVNRICQNFIKELPRADDVSVTQASIYSLEQKKVINENVR